MQLFTLAPFSCFFHLSKTKEFIVISLSNIISNPLIRCFLQFSAYCVVAKDTVGKQISIAFLERVAADFKKRYGGGKAGTAVAKSLNKEFGYALSTKC